MMNSRIEQLVPGVAGVVEDGILPGYFGYETGQASVGDAFAWLVETFGLSHDELDATRGEAPARQRRRARDRLAQRLPHAAHGRPAQRRVRRPHARHAAGAALPRADGGDRVRRALDRRHAPRRRRPRPPLRRQRRAAREEPAAHADLRRRARTSGSRWPRATSRSPSAPRSSAAPPRAGRATGYATSNKIIRAMAPSARSSHYAPTPQAHRAYDELYEMYRSLADPQARRRGDAAAPHAMKCRFTAETQRRGGETFCFSVFTASLRLRGESSSTAGRGCGGGRGRRRRR